ncbi:MAG: ankyrin repeat domain-containing protein [Planctomycetota bacterium]
MNVSADIGAPFLAVSLCLIAAGDGRGAEVGQSALDTSLICCVRNGDADEVAELLQRGANPRAANTSGMTALQYAAMNGHVEILKMLISKGAEVNTRDIFGRTPILEAAGGRNAQAVKLLLEAGATAHPEALGFACWLNRGKSVALLLQAGVSPDGGMVQAAQGGHVELLRLLLDRGANVNVRSKSGDTALHTAALQGGIEALRLLLKEGADPNAKNDRGQTPLHMAISGACEVNSLRLLIDAGSKVDVPNKEGVTPIRLAAIRGNSEGYKLLLAANGGVERRSSKGETSRTHQHSRTTAELIDDLTSDAYRTRQAAEVALVARGRGIMPQVMQSIESGADIERFYGLFQKMGPDAEAALPKLRSLLGEKKHVFGAAMTMERMKPGSFAELPERSREKAAAALCDAAIDPEAGEMAGFYLVFLYSLGDVATPYILKLLRSDKPEHRAAAAASIDLGRFHDDAIEGELVKMLRADDDLSARYAARALGTLGVLSDEASAALLAVIRDQAPYDPLEKDENKRRRSHELRRLSDAAAGSLGKAGPSIIDDLIPMLSPMDAPERRAAMVALRSMGAPAVPRLIELLAHEDAAVATSASVALNRIGRPAVAALAKALDCRNEQVIERATSALWWIGAGAKEAIPALLEVAGSEERSDIERLAAARAALKIDAEGARNSKAILSTIPVLIRTLEQGRFRYQGWAAETLRGIGPDAREALPMLRKRLELPREDADTGGLVRSYVRAEAGRAIAAIEARSPKKAATNP